MVINRNTFLAIVELPDDVHKKLSNGTTIMAKKRKLGELNYKRKSTYARFMQKSIKRSEL